MSARVAILGAGIMGSCLALMLARRGFAIDLFDRNEAPLAAASRWNEGKIHLGYLYGADSTLSTARHILPGGLVFGDLVSGLIETDLAAHMTTEDDIYLVHRDSVVSPETLETNFDGVSALVRAHADASRYLVDVSDARTWRLSPQELGSLANSEVIVAGYRVPERSVATRWVADRLCGALEAEARVNLRLGVTVTGARPDDAIGGPWRVTGEPGIDEPYDLVVNALWDGRLAIDLSAGLLPEAPWSHRYRLCLFVRTKTELRTKSCLVAVGPFGDIKNYNGRDFYLSWYPVGLVAQGDQVTLQEPVPLAGAERESFVANVRKNLARVMPPVSEIFEYAEEVEVGGGFVFAQGQGSIGDAKSTLHRRDGFGVRRLGSYFSIDTGKYSTAPWCADQLTREICGD